MKPFSKNSNITLADRFRSPVGVTSLLFGLVSAVLFPVTVKMSFEQEGLATMLVGAMGLFALFIAIIGLILAFMDINNDDTPMSLPRFTRTLNIVCIVVWGAVMAWGIWG